MLSAMPKYSQIPLLTADDYRALPETGPRYQLIEGGNAEVMEWWSTGVMEYWSTGIAVDRSIDLSTVLGVTLTLEPNESPLPHANCRVEIWRSGVRCSHKLFTDPFGMSVSE
jgi:hypothetical protein